MSELWLRRLAARRPEQNTPCHRMASSRSTKNVRHRRRRPSRASGGSDATRIERRSNLAQRKSLIAQRPGQRRDIAGEAIGFDAKSGGGDPASLGDLRIADRERLAGASDTAHFGRGERRLGALPDVPPLLLGHRRVDVEHERIDVKTQLANVEGDFPLHQPGDECNVAAEPIEPRDKNRALTAPRVGHRRRQNRPALERVHPLSGLDFDEFRCNFDVIRFGEAANCLALRLDA